MNKFELKSKFEATKPQKIVIDKILNNLSNNEKHNVLKGATGSGKTFLIANIIKKNSKPTLIMAHNKTLVNQLYIELKNFFPNNRIEYYISNFDYYIPEAYIPAGDKYIEKKSMQNWKIELMRNSTLTSLLTREDVIVVASVASIYGHRKPEEYKKHILNLNLDEKIERNEVISKLVSLNYKRSTALVPGSFVTKGDVIELSPSWTENFNIRIEMYDDKIERIVEINQLNKDIIGSYKFYSIFPNNPNVSTSELIKTVIDKIKFDLKIRLNYFKKNNLLIEKQRLEQRVNFDIEQLNELGFTQGIENYSLYFDNRVTGEPPYTLFDYFAKDYLLIIDESHITIPQLHAMYKGDRSRKETLVKYGFRLPAALDNRPLNFQEFEKKVNKVIYMSATPGKYEFEKTKISSVEELILRPTGLLDPEIEVRGSNNQIEDLYKEILDRKKKGERVLVSTITRKLSEDIATYFKKLNLSVAYLHYDLKTFERENVIRKLRIGYYDAIVGINLLREGLDLPEVSLIAILDADNEGLLRNKTSLMQMIGRVARNVNGKAILYVDRMTDSIKYVISETDRRRKIQIKYNLDNNITPTTIKKDISDLMLNDFEILYQKKLPKFKRLEKIEFIEKQMKKAAINYDFEKAIKLRDLLLELKTGN